jgi:hypothetical protein
MPEKNINREQQEERFVADQGISKEELDFLRTQRGVLNGVNHPLVRRVVIAISRRIGEPLDKR